MSGRRSRPGLGPVPARPRVLVDVSLEHLMSTCGSCSSVKLLRWTKMDSSLHAVSITTRRTDLCHCCGPGRRSSRACRRRDRRHADRRSSVLISTSGSPKTVNRMPAPLFSIPSLMIRSALIPTSRTRTQLSWCPPRRPPRRCQTPCQMLPLPVTPSASPFVITDS